MQTARLVLAYFVWVGMALGAWAQGADEVQPPLMTLHLYANLAQVPVLVLDHRLNQLPPIPFDRFRLSVDSGKPFTPTRVRREGDDTISLSLVLDVSGSETELLKQLPEAVGGWAQRSLNAQDQVSVYAVDCSLVLAGNRLSGSDGAHLIQAVEQALGSRLVHGPKGKPADHAACWTKKPLWDALDIVAAQMAGRPGRRVMLVVTDGFDGGSQRTWRDVRERASATGTTVFALSTPSLSRAPAPMMEDHLTLLCQLTGGLALPAYTLLTDLRNVVQTLRNRYILEFPRPQNLEAGKYDLRVLVLKQDVLALSPGVTMSVESAEEKAQENQPTDRAAGPEPGPRHTIKPEK